MLFWIMEENSISKDNMVEVIKDAYVEPSEQPSANTTSGELSFPQQLLLLTWPWVESYEPSYFQHFSEPDKYGEIKGLASFISFLPSPKAKLEIDGSVCATNSPPASYLSTVLGFAFKCRGQTFLFKIEKQCAPHWKNKKKNTDIKAVMYCHCFAA